MTPPVATTAGRALPRTVSPRGPRRVSGPAPRAKQARPPRDPTRRRAAAAPADPFVLRAMRRARLLADSRLLDRLVRGRLWIPLVAAGLMGIVFMQVTMLKLNSGIGRAVQSAQTLERQNGMLRADISRMESGERIDSVARGVGMVVPADGGEHYVTAGGRDAAARAVAHMTAPDATALARAQAATRAAAGQVSSGAGATGTTATGAATAATAQTPASTAAGVTATTASTAATGTPLASGTSTPPPTGTTTPVTPAATQTQTQASGATAAPPPTTSSQQQSPPAATSGGIAAPTGGAG